MIIKTNFINSKEAINFITERDEYISNLSQFVLQSRLVTSEKVSVEVIFSVGDTLPPEIIVNSPSKNILYRVDSPIFNISLFDINGVDTVWYTVDDIFTNFTFIANGSVDQFIVSGFIDQSIWDSLEDGTVILGFYANDTVGNIGAVNTTVSIRTYMPDGIATFPFESLIIILIIIMSIILILGNVIVKKKRI
ncbi:hypothetical protein LCGC14_1052740 [marine sediment metagenome]|uniref:Uncharacterized protein n=1 Tax=marine sediment metagenome TaxID=412755 RepID=A0A0F9NA85_9ZZZZ